MRHLRALGHRLADCLENRRPRRDGTHRALPVDRPAAALHADVVRPRAGHVNPRDVVRQGQQFVFVLEEHDGLAHRLTRDGAVLGRAERFLETSIGIRAPSLVEQARGKLDPQDPSHGIVDTFHRNRAFLDQALQSLEEQLVPIRDHHHVHAGVDRRLDVARVVAGELVDRLEVGNQEAFEAELFLQDLGKEPVASRHLLAVRSSCCRKA